MRNSDECRYEIVKLFEQWKKENFPNLERVASTDAIQFFAELREHNSKWLEFKYRGDKWQQVHSWLVQAKLCD